MQTQFKRCRPVKRDVMIRDSFWDKRLERFATTTLIDSFDKFDRTNIPDNFDNIGNAEAKHNGYPFMDGLFYEMLRGAADYLKSYPDKALEARVDGYIRRIEKAQAASGDGYINTFTTREMPAHRLGADGGNLIWQHDTYNIGCLIEAGVHYYAATGKPALLGCALRAANYLCGVVGPEPRRNVSPGHSMIEGALIELYDLVAADAGITRKTGVPADAKRYLELAHSFVHMHGRYENRMSYPQYMGEYAQDHAPIEYQREAVGHAVRATLFYHGAALVADREDDEALIKHVMRLWYNVVQQKMYLSGGVGATHFEEKFSYAYDLPNTGYMETCATVGMMFWAADLQYAFSRAEFADVYERCLFNLMLSSVSQTGTFYFYGNPLSSKGTDHRWAWHNCPCCPPMIHKLMGTVKECLYAEDDEGLFVNQYIGSSVRAGGLAVEMNGNYPYQGDMNIRILEDARGERALRLRVPDWCRSWRLTLNGDAYAPEMDAGYAVVRRAFRQGDAIAFVMDMPAQRVEAHPYVRQNTGKIAITRGPLLYCFEGVDNAGDTELTVAENWQPSVVYEPDLFGGTPVIDVSDANGKRFRAIPLFLWDNRAAGGMNTWVNQAGKPVEDTASEDWNGTLYRPYRPDGNKKGS